MTQPVFDNGAFQVELEDGAKPLSGSNVYFMFGQEYSFTLESLTGFLRFLLGSGILDDIQVNVSDTRRRLT